MLRLDDPAAVCELIALTIGIGEDRVDLGAGLADLRDIGSDAAGVVGKALAPIGAPVRPRSAGALPAATPVTTTSGSDPEPDPTSEGNTSCSATGM